MRMGDPVVVTSGSSSSSRSRSSSPKREKYDRFGRIVPTRSHSRSKSRSRRILEHRRQSRKRSRSNSHQGIRSRGGRRSRSLSLEQEKHLSNKTNIDDPRFLKARVFIGALPVDKVTKEDLEQKFGQYGKVLGVSIHDRGFGFIQFDKEEEARKAVDNEKGSLYKGNVLDVKMAAEGRRNRDQPRAGGRSKSPFNRDRGYPASTSSGGPPMRDGLSSQPPVRERSPIRGAEPFDDRYRDPYRDRALPPLRRDDPYYADPYRRPLPADDLYFDRYRDDPYRYRREPYNDSYRERDPYFRDYFDLPPPPPRKPSPPDCMIIIMNAKLRKYAEIVDERLRVQMLVDIVVIPEDRTVPQMIEEASLKKCLFAIIINSQNEAHRSITLNIIHGTPQEHRNMPLEDAMSLILRSHDQYLQAAREKSATQALPTPRPQAPAVPSIPFIPPGAETSYLLNLLADNRQLTIEELDKVIIYLKERKEKLMEVEGRRQPPALNNEGLMSYEGGDQQPSQAYLQQQQQELQAKILSILNGSGASNSPAAGTGGGNMPNASPAGISSMGHASARGGAPISHATQQGSGGSTMINLDHPNVQKALDNLIQSGPNLLRSIASNSSVQSPPIVSNSMMMNRGGMTNTTGGMYSGQQPQPLMQQQGYAGQNRQPPGLSMGQQNRSMMAQQARARPM
ncbi:hypothetical protein ACJMK2_009931 [Sinanodonta woodiana]|uniref:RRM domain-containing protein n=2 Tax=Sinanodonta woodiana TaxID=1069815 RepID=A0ABD3VG57_SINWO